MIKLLDEMGKKPRDPELVALGKALREFRENSGTSLRELAKMLGVDKNLVSRIERGMPTRRLSDEELNRWAVALNRTAVEVWAKAGLADPKATRILAKTDTLI